MKKVTRIIKQAAGAIIDRLNSLPEYEKHAQECDYDSAEEEEQRKAKANKKANR